MESSAGGDGERHRGILVRSTGDGVLAAFDGPSRAVRRALAFGTAAGQMDMPRRAGQRLFTSLDSLVDPGAG